MCVNNVQSPLPAVSALTIFPIFAFFIEILSWSLRGGKSSAVTAVLEVTEGLRVIMLCSNLS